MKRFLYILLLSFFAFTTFAKETILVGDIVDEATGEPIPNAHIYYQATQVGTTSDQQGAFMLRADLPRKRTLVISAVGYHTQRFPIEAGTMAGMQVTLREKTALLAEVIALPTDNPALPLIAAVRANRNRHDRTLLPISQTAEATTQLFISDIQRRHLQRMLFRSLQKGLLTREDSTFLLPLYVSQERVRLSGKEQTPIGDTQQQALILTANDYSALLAKQGNINFYQSSINLLGRSFLSPLAPAGPTYYRYYLVDSLQTNAGKQYQVDFRTRNPFYATFDGTMYIDSASFALRSIQATVPARTSVNYLSNLRIYQTLAPDNRLLREELSVLLDFAIQTDTTHLFPTVLWQQSLQADSLTTTSYLPAKDTLQTPLVATTAAFDSLANTPIIRTAQWLASILTTGYIPTGTPIDIGHIEEILQVNHHEGVHIGLPFRTNQHLWRHVSLEASVGYGFRDRAWKGLGRVQIDLPTPRRNILTLEYQDHYVWAEVDDFSRLLRENSIGFKNMDFTAYAFEALRSNPYAVNTAIRQRQLQLRTENDWTDYLETQAYLRLGKTNDTYPRWQTDTRTPALEIQESTPYRYVSLGTIFRLSFHERKTDYYFRRVHAYSQYPVLYLGIEGGQWQTSAMSRHQLYARLNILLRQQLSLGMGGTLDYALSAGWIFGTVPYTLLHHFEGNQGYAYDPYRFTLMNNMQFAADRYLALHAEWNGQGILFNLIPGIRYLHLRELVTFKIAYGTISAYNQTLLSTIPAPTTQPIDKGTNYLPQEKQTFPMLQGMGNIPYIEIGVGIGNILRVADLYSVWRLTRLNDPTTPRWALRFRIHIGL